MKLLKVGLVAGIQNNSGYETIVRVLSEPEILEVCTPVLFGSQKKAIQTLKSIKTEQPVSFNVVKAANEVLDGRINIVDGLESEADSLSSAIAAYMNNCIDVVAAAPSEIINSTDKHDLTEFIAKAIESETKGLFDWEINDSTRALLLHPMDISENLGEGLAVEAFMNDLTTINKSLRKDYTLIKPRIAVFSSIDKVHKDLVELREHGVFAFGPFGTEMISQDKNLPYDALLFLNEDNAFELLKKGLNSDKTFGYVSGLPMVATYILNDTEVCPQNMKEAIYAAIDIFKARISYRRATHNPLEKQWIPRGRDDFKLDLTKEEAE